MWIRHCGKPNEMREQLDMSIVSDAWLSKFPQGMLHNVFDPISNHFTNILQTEEHVFYNGNRGFSSKINWFENHV